MSIICVLKAIGVWLMFLLVGTNLIGLIVRGVLWRPPPVDGPTVRVEEILAAETRRLRRANTIMTVIPIIATVAYFVAIYHFGSAILAGAAALPMLARLPDLLVQARADRKLSRSEMPKGGIYTIAPIVMCLTLPLVWYAMCWF